MTVYYNWLLEEANIKSTVQLFSQNIYSINNKHLERLIAKVNYSDEHLIWITVCKLTSTAVLKEPSTADFYCHYPCDALRPFAGESFVVLAEWLEQEVKTIDANKELMGIHGKLGRQFFPHSPLPWAAAPTRAGGVPQGEPLCGYHTPSSGCTRLKARGERREEEGAGGQCLEQLVDPH